ncbi:MAG TPA: energy transducer TonB [Candidatus Acidoferrum sp.]|nr:energy transducer TonB [Candidatus Acidoferrum sp.]
MIPRTLVPYGSRPPEDASSARRRPTTLDERALVPSTMPVVALETKSNIPANLPLDSIAARVVVPRDISQEAYGPREESSLPPQPTELDERVTIPQGALPPLVIARPENVPLDLVEPDVFLTGEVNFLAPETKDDKKAKAQLYTRISSFVFHALLIILIIWQPNLFRRHMPSAEEQEIARKQMVLLVPPGAFGTSRPAPRVIVPPAPRIKVDPRILRELAPPTPAPPPEPKPKPEELPSAPAPQPNAAPPPKPAAPAPKQEIASNIQPRLESPDSPQPHPNLILPKSTGNTLQDALRDMQRNPIAGGRSGGVSGPMPKQPGTPGVDIPGAGGGGGSFGNGYQILTPTEGVDFSDYMARVLASVRRNWYAVMPQSAMLGDRGRVILEFTIRKDGSVPGDEPVPIMGSGKEPLDRAAISAIRSSNPFEPLPPAFSGPEIRLRFIFLYNLPLDAAYK